MDFSGLVILGQKSNLEKNNLFSPFLFPEGTGGIFWLIYTQFKEEPEPALQSQVLWRIGQRITSLRTGLYCKKWHPGMLPESLP